MRIVKPFSLYQEVKEGRVDIVHAAERNPDLVSTLDPVFGCEPWTPSRAIASRIVQGLDPQGNPVSFEVCATCGGGLKRDGEDGIDPNQFCAACYRSWHDSKIERILGRETRNEQHDG